MGCTAVGWRPWTTGRRLWYPWGWDRWVGMVRTGSEGRKTQRMAGYHGTRRCTVNYAKSVALGICAIRRRRSMQNGTLLMSRKKDPAQGRVFSLFTNSSCTSASDSASSYAECSAKDVFYRGKYAIYNAGNKHYYAGNNASSCVGDLLDIFRYIDFDFVHGICALGDYSPPRKQGRC